MAKQMFSIEVDVMDVKTGLTVRSYGWIGESSSIYRAKRKAAKECKGYALEDWKWSTASCYGLTVKQLNTLINDGLISTANLFEVADIRVQQDEPVNLDFYEVKGEDGLTGCERLMQEIADGRR